MQIAVSGCPASITPDKLGTILRNLWTSWYIRPNTDFENLAAWEKHKDTVMNILEKEILAPLEQYISFQLYSRNEREAFHPVHGS